MVSRVSWGPEEGTGSHAAGFRVPGTVGEGANIHNAEIKHSLNYYTYQVLQLTRENVPSYNLFYSFVSSRFPKISMKYNQFYSNYNNTIFFNLNFANTAAQF